MVSREKRSSTGFGGMVPAECVHRRESSGESSKCLVMYFDT